MIFVGVDGCKKGWLAVKLSDGREWEVKVFKDIGELWSDYHDAAVILIDIPIGLLDSGPQERKCDVEARKLLGNKRGPSVFRSPCRPAVYSSTERASAVNLHLTGKRLPRQTLGILLKIREVDMLMLGDKSARSVIKETHPEICFWSFAGNCSLKLSKKDWNGYQMRREILQSLFPMTLSIVEHVSDNFRRKDVATDDILDALVLAITAKKGVNRFCTIPEISEMDSKGLRMEMVYFAPAEKKYDRG